LEGQETNMVHSGDSCSIPFSTVIVIPRILERRRRLLCFVEVRNILVRRGCALC
jgi:hypothetical protein